MEQNQNNPGSDPIDGRLEAYAQHRRRELENEPITLDEATRTMLQGEVKRVYPEKTPQRPVAEERGMPAWLPWVMGGAVCALALVFSLDFNSASKATYPMELAAADPKSPKPIPAAEGSAESGGKLGLEDRDIRSESAATSSRALTVPSVAKETADVTALNEPKKISPAKPVPAPFGLAAAEAPAPPAEEKQNLRMSKGGLTPRRANSPASVPRAIRSAAPTHKALTARSAPPVPHGRGIQPHQSNYYNNLSQLRQNFRQASVTSNASSKRRQKSIPQPVLLNFQVERRGNIVRILDQDGSVYTGNVINEEKYDNSGNGIELAKGELRKQRGQTPSKTEVRDAVTDSRDQGQFYFRVQGNNKTLQQMVVIEATLDGAIPAENGISGSNRSFSASPKLERSIPLPGAGLSADRKETEKIAQSAGKKAVNREALYVPQFRLLGNTRIGKDNYRLDAFQTPSGSHRPAVNLKADTPAPKK
ncbi:MAG: hypothetical protein QF406_04165 [Verrucomicrobiota bacterium]|nr:hypothetical protein [Verrucomicrobiota bacterium]